MGYVNIHPMDLSAIIKAVITPQGDRTGRSLTHLHPGDQLTAKVLSIENDGRVLVDLSGSRVLAEVGFPVKQGQTLPMQVVRNGPVIHLQVLSPQQKTTESPNIKTVTIPQKGHFSEIISNLQPGDKLAGKVMQFHSDGRALIDLGGSREWAHLNFKANIGEHLNLKVVENGSTLHLQVETPKIASSAQHPAPQVDFSKSMAPHEQEKWLQISDRLLAQPRSITVPNAVPTGIQNAFIQIRTFFQSVPLEASVKQASLFIKTNVEDSGLLFEKRMADMVTETMGANKPGEKIDPSLANPRLLITRDAKSQLLMIQRFLAGASDQDLAAYRLEPKDVLFLQSRVDQMLGYIEQQQEHALSRWADGDNHQVFVHMMALPDQDKPLQLKVYYPRKEEGKDRDHPYRIALLLNMDQLGAVRSDLTMINDHLQIGFFVENERIKNILASEVDTVKTSLSGYFEEIMIDVSINKDKITQFSEEDSAGAASGRINIIA